MPLLAFLSPLVSWIFRTIVVKFVVLSSIFAALTLLIPKAIELLSPFLGVSSLSSAFALSDSGVWWFLDLFSLGYGVPLIISAYITRFLIRRLPFIG